uniref:Cytochrome c domain-containing protein n=1 Tax=Desulfatirhabdium butyrativorans TaxID=340467 RepID=A0A7C4RT86_9BACT
MKRSAFLVVAIVMGIAAVFHATADAADPSPEAAILKSCTVCHGAAKICQQIGKKDEAQWKATIERMVKKGADLPANLQAPAAAYLAGTKAASGPLCDKK